jgi:hypothetical protein
MSQGGIRFGQTVSTFQGKQKGGSRIKVAVRIRPLMEQETRTGHTAQIVQADEEMHRVV